MDRTEGTRSETRLDCQMTREGDKQWAAGCFMKHDAYLLRSCLPTGDQYPVGDTKVENEIEYWSREDSRRENKHQRINKIRVYSGIGYQLLFSRWC